jgi:hypothetical protein
MYLKIHRLYITRPLCTIIGPPDTDCVYCFRSPSQSDCPAADPTNKETKGFMGSPSMELLPQETLFDLWNIRAIHLHDSVSRLTHKTRKRWNDISALILEAPQCLLSATRRLHQETSPTSPAPSQSYVEGAQLTFNFVLNFGTCTA